MCRNDVRLVNIIDCVCLWVLLFFFNFIFESYMLRISENAAITLSASFWQLCLETGLPFYCLSIRVCHLCNCLPDAL